MAARHVLDVPAAEDGAEDLLVDVVAFAGCAHGRTEQQLAARLQHAANFCRVDGPVGGRPCRMIAVLADLGPAR
jgi:hypothetical protein